jgi:uncharacterized membrane protein
MTKTIVGYFDHYHQAQEAVRALVDSGFPRNDISLVASDPAGEYTQYEAKSSTVEDEISSTATGAGAGAVVGGVGGLLVGLGALTIPGIGPVLAAGPLATTLLGAGVGAAAGGLIGSLIDLGIPKQEAGYYAEGLRRGGAVVTISTMDEGMVNRVIDIFERYGAVDIDRRVEEWRQSGWIDYDPNTTPYTEPSVSRSGAPSGAPLRRFEDYNSDFRSHFTNMYANQGYTYDRYEPAYRYGYTLANDTRYVGKDWADIEGEARRNWETNNHASWEDFKASIRYAWDRVQGYSAAEASARSHHQAA